MSRSGTYSCACNADALLVTLQSEDSRAKTRPGSIDPSIRQRVLGDFIIEREIGRGGMGVVWLATQRSLGRRVALKALPNFAAMDADAVLRFRREAEATARLAHPGIVPVYGFGESDGIHWFAMEFIDGPTLAGLLDTFGMRQVEKLRGSLVEEAMVADRYKAMREVGGGPGSSYVRSCVRLCAELANALAAAHRAGVVHRDLKPSNVMIHPAGRPVLVDFGLARDEQQQALTRSGEQIGTPAYMAPEQARGHRDVDSRADIYGLGAVLYELLTLRPPFCGVTAAEVTIQILTEDPEPVRRRNPTVPVDLAAVVHRCLAKMPDDRYPAMEALEHDLRSFLAGRPVTATLPSRLARIHAVLQRKWRAFMIGAGAAIAATAIAVVAGLVDDRGDIRRGNSLLQMAQRRLVEHADVAQARSLYDQAQALTKDAALVAEARVRDFRAAFQRHYHDKEHGVAALVAFSASLTVAERGQVQDLLERLDGRGSLEFASRTVERATETLEARAVHGDQLTADWQTVQAGTAMAKGGYLLRATSKDGVVSHMMVQVDADAASVVAPRYVRAGDLPPDAVVMVDPLDSRAIGIAETEVTRGVWERWIASLADPLLISELTPKGVPVRMLAADMPVRGLSFAQARAFARACGAHLPTMREQWLAGSSGIPSLLVPWGSTVEFARLAADPFHLDEALPVRAKPDGRSPLGIYNLLGNVAEIQSALADGVLRMGGGSFLDDPATLFLQGALARVPSVSLPLQGHPAAGVRMYWFVEPVVGDDKEVNLAAKAREQRRDDLRAANEVCLFSDWTLQRDGAVQCRVEWNGKYHAGESRQLALPFDTQGFLQRLERVRVLDGHGTEMPRTALVSVGGERSRLDATLGEYRDGQGYRFAIEATLEGVDGLVPVRDGYVLRLPMKRPSRVAQVYTLTLPRGCRVDDVQPQPTSWSADRRTMTFEQSEGQIETAVVRFRCDGAIGAVAVAQGPIAERTERFLQMWNQRSGNLGELLDRDFIFSPGRFDRADVVRSQPFAWLLPPKEGQLFVDAMRTGEIENVELRIDWKMRGRDQLPFELLNWPFLVQWRQRAGKSTVVRLQPMTAVDAGRYDARGGYFHEGLRISLDKVQQGQLSRTQEELVDLQIKLTHGEGRMVQITGCLADVAELPAAVRFRLSGGASILRPGRRLDAGAADAQNQEWIFVADGCISRERWTIVQRGQRQVLLRCSVTGVNEAAAERAFAAEDSREWFESVRSALRMD
jgi:serine/threonine protein kinase